MCKDIDKQDVEGMYLDLLFYNDYPPSTYTRLLILNATLGQRLMGETKSM